MLFPMSPYVLDGIQFRRIARKELQIYPASCPAHEVSHHSAAMRLDSVPDHDEIASEVSEKVLQKLHYLRTPDRSRVEAEVEVPPGDPRDSRKRMPVEVILKHWRLTLWCPGAVSLRPFAQSALVDENYCPALFAGFFLSSGHRFSFHRRILSSSRSKARPVGRWQLHPNRRNNHHTWPSVYFTPHSRSIRSATRHAVQSEVSYPSASGPRSSPASILRRSDSVSLGFRPARPAFFRPLAPSCSSCRTHRFTDCRCTPTRLATSASCTPFFRSCAACSRRFSSASKSRLTPAGFPMHRIVSQYYRYVTILSDIQ